MSQDPSKHPEAEPLLNQEELAEAFNVQSKTIAAWRRRGMPCAQDGGQG
jgi:phage terminase Nu1 subunit (DNA packaging protein)